MSTDGRTGIHDETSGRFSQFCEDASRRQTNLAYGWNIKLTVALGNENSPRQYEIWDWNVGLLKVDVCYVMSAGSTCPPFRRIVVPFSPVSSVLLYSDCSTPNRSKRHVRNCVTFRTTCICNTRQTNRKLTFCHVFYGLRIWIVAQRSVCLTFLPPRIFEIICLH